MNGVLVVNDLSVRYRNKSIITGINLSLPLNSLMTILGPSGVGKSTLLRTLNRLIDEEEGFSRSGKIFYRGKDVDCEIALTTLRRNIGIILQKPVIFPISIFKNVIFGIHHLGLKPRKDYPDIVEGLLKKVSLWEEVSDRLHASALELSAGQQQRLAIARTLALEPNILLADEITSSLDGESSGKIEKLLIELKTTHSIIVVTHQVEQALRLSDSIMCLENVEGAGKMDFWGTPDKYYKIRTTAKNGSNLI